LYIAATPNGICRIAFNTEASIERFLSDLKEKYGTDPVENRAYFSVLLDLLDRYFAGEKVTFDLPLDLTDGSDFQRQVWNRLQEIPYGQTISYQQLANDIGKPGAVRAVGAANGANPIPILIPCHRVIASNGKLGGYSGGIEIKDALLRLEGAIL